jgi:hypothetical protein
LLHRLLHERPERLPSLPARDDRREIGAGKKAVTISTMTTPTAGKTCLTCHTDFVEVARWRNCRRVG